MAMSKGNQWRFKSLNKAGYFLGGWGVDTLNFHEVPMLISVSCYNVS